MDRLPNFLSNSAPIARALVELHYHQVKDRLQGPTLAIKCGISLYFLFVVQIVGGSAGGRTVTLVPTLLGCMDNQIFLTIPTRKEKI